jgi:hypothetical protein
MNPKFAAYLGLALNDILSSKSVQSRERNPSIPHTGEQERKPLPKIKKHKTKRRGNKLHDTRRKRRSKGVNDEV